MNTLRGREVSLTHEVHTLENAGAEPARATIFSKTRNCNHYLIWIVFLEVQDIKDELPNESWFDLKFRCVVRRMVMQWAGQTSSSRITNGDSSSNLEFGAINPSGVIPNCRFESGPHSQLLFYGPIAHYW